MGDATSRVPGFERQAFVERLRAILAQWPSVDRLARAVGVSPSALRKWLRGEAEPSRERLVAIARATGVGVGWLAEGEGAQPVFDAATDGGQGTAGDAKVLVDKNFVLLPRRPEAAAAGSVTPEAPSDTGFPGTGFPGTGFPGTGFPGTGFPGTGYIALRRDWVRAVCRVEPEQLALDTAVGQSMTPTIGDGTLLLIDTTDQTFRSFGVYVLEIAGQRVVKRVQRKFDGSLVLISDNSAYQPDAVDKDAVREITVIGRVVWTGGPI